MTKGGRRDARKFVETREYEYKAKITQYLLSNLGDKLVVKRFVRCLKICGFD